VIPPTIRWTYGELSLLDQRALPAQEIYLRIDSIDAAVDAIRTLAVRGAPAIGIAAAYALTRSVRDEPSPTFLERLRQNGRRLKSARPTAVNLAWAVDRLVETAERDPRYAVLESEARAIHEEDRASCRAIGEAGRHLIEPGARVLTHCNAGALATAGLGTATAPMYLAHEDGVSFQVFADETRPLLQGARLTAWELSRTGIEVTLLCDNAAASLMASGGIDLVIVGTDRVAANGDVVNKIGTLALAVLCRHFGIPFYVACPSSTFDPATPIGAAVQIEQRDGGEIIGPGTARVPAYNPAFDVTPAALVTGLITDRGLIGYPPEPSLADQIGGH
jgi:methylthioribose-1-phosphate isomerase